MTKEFIPPSDHHILSDGSVYRNDTQKKLLNDLKNSVEEFQMAKPRVSNVLEYEKKLHQKLREKFQHKNLHEGTDK